MLRPEAEGSGQVVARRLRLQRVGSAQMSVTHAPAGATTTASKSAAETVELQSGSLVIPN